MFRADHRWTQLFVLGREGDFPKVLARRIALSMTEAARRTGLAEVVDAYPTAPREAPATVRAEAEIFTREALIFLALCGVTVFGTPAAAVPASAPAVPVAPVVSVSGAGTGTRSEPASTKKPASIERVPPVVSSRSAGKAHYDEDMRLLLDLELLRPGQQLVPSSLVKVGGIWRLWSRTADYGFRTPGICHRPVPPRPRQAVPLTAGFIGAPWTVVCSTTCGSGPESGKARRSRPSGAPARPASGRAISDSTTSYPRQGAGIPITDVGGSVPRICSWLTEPEPQSGASGRPDTARHGCPPTVTPASPPPTTVTWPNDRVRTTVRGPRNAHKRDA